MLFVPSAKPGDGIGHLRRSLDLLNAIPGSALYLEDEVQNRRARAVTSGLRIPSGRIVNRIDGAWDLIVLDRRATKREELPRFGEHAIILGIDEGGEVRELLPYLIDTLPLPTGRSKPNLFSTGFQSQPARRRSPDDPETGRALVSFGGEDPGGLTQRMISALVDGGHYSAEQLTVVVGPLFSTTVLPEGVRRLDAPPELRELLCEYDIVFTSFGLTAYEAVNSGVSAVLYNPSGYHRRLSRIGGFPEVGVGRVDRGALKRLLSDPSALRETCSRIAVEPADSLADHISRLAPSGTDACPVCGNRENPVVGRFSDRSFLRCRGCTMVYEIDFSKKRSQYDRSYFFEDYQKQYGRTYLEDFENIRRLSRVRVASLASVGGRLSGRSLLDVGCAFGPFLLEARGSGAEVYGVDISEEAVEYVRGTLNLPCARSALEDFDLQTTFGIDRVNILTMWYVIEHFADVGRVLAKINSLIHMGGILAFSTPNCYGISGRSNLESFLSKSPYDHFTVWDPRTAETVLKRFGFQVREIRVTGHHPERSPVFGASHGWRYSLLRRVSEAAKLGDTFECYAVKVSETTK